MSGAMIDSPILGESVILSEYERDELDQLTYESPVDVFQSLNKYLNTRGLMLNVLDLTELPDE